MTRDQAKQLHDTYAPLVRRIATNIARRIPVIIALEDLVNIGWVGLLEAYHRRPDDMVEAHFVAIASHRIRGSIIDYLRSLDNMPRRIRGQARLVEGTIQKLTQELSRLPEDEEVADALNMTISEYLGVHARFNELKQAVELELDMPDLRQDDPETLAIRQNLLEAAARTYDELPDRLKLVAKMYYEDGCSLREIGALLGVTESRASQLHARATELMRAEVESLSSERLNSLNSRLDIRRPTTPHGTRQ